MSCTPSPPHATATGKRPKLDTDLAEPGNPDLSSSVLVDSPVLPDEGREGHRNAGAKWWVLVDSEELGAHKKEDAA